MIALEILLIWTIVPAPAAILVGRMIGWGSP